MRLLDTTVIDKKGQKQYKRKETFVYNFKKSLRKKNFF